MAPSRAAARTALGLCLGAALVCAALAQPISPSYDNPLPSVVRICVIAYPPFCMQRNWQGLRLSALSSPPGFDQPYGLSGISFSGANVTMLDGYDISFATMIFRDYLNIDITYMPYPDKSSFYVGLRNGECDLGMGGVELDPDRAICDRGTCQDTSVTPLTEYGATDYGDPAYNANLDNVCCVDYGVPYYQSGFALMSIATNAPTSVISAIASVDVLNAGTPVIIAIIGFGAVLSLLERRTNKQFAALDNSVYFGFVATSTFGFGDMAPVTMLGRFLVVFWTIFTVLSLTAFGGIVSAALTVGQLQMDTIDSLGAIQPNQLCVEGSYDLANRFIAETMSLPLDQYVQVGGGVMLGSLEECTAAVLNGTVLAYLSDVPVLNWVAFSYINNGNMYVSPTLRANPLTWVFPSGSTIRQSLDSAVISTIVNTTWLTTRESLDQYWFGAGTVSPSVPASTVNVPTLVAALVLVFAWFMAAIVRQIHMAVQARKERNAKPAAEEAPPVPIARPAALAAAAAREAARAAEAAAQAAEAAAAEEAKARSAVLTSGKMPFMSM